ncbi:MAG: hypothetical protein L6R37_003426 [Teloschistes peruensis]|nr:MAG: hypothetical protein L6R37_003426 [Teloschistes peruensis]
MAKHTFHLTPHASSPLYIFISSSRFRLSMFILTVLDIVLFSIGIGLGAKYIEDRPYADLDIRTHFCEELALGIMFLPFTWLLFLLVWDALKKPKLHPVYDREKKANRKLQQKGVRLQSPRDSSSEERIGVPANVVEPSVLRGDATQELSSV